MEISYGRQDSHPTNKNKHANEVTLCNVNNFYDSNPTTNIYIYIYIYIYFITEEPSIAKS